MKKVLVIVVTYNGMQWLERCLGSVIGTADVYVWDNDSTDGSADYVESHFPKVKLMRSADNLGFSVPNNMGFKWAVEKGYDYVYLLNQDAWLKEGALEKLVEAAESHPEYAVLSPLQYQDGYKELDRQFAKDKPPPAAHWLVRVEALRKIGLFNEKLFPFYGQDDDWCNRARYHRYSIGIVNEALAVHDRAQRKEPKEKIIDRNYRVGSLMRLCDIRKPLAERFLFVVLFTLVKTVKYFSFLPIKHFVGICRQLSEVKSARMSAKNGGTGFV